MIVVSITISISIAIADFLIRVDCLTTTTTTTTTTNNDKMNDTFYLPIMFDFVY